MYALGTMALKKLNPFSSLWVLGTFGVVVLLAAIVAAWWYLFHGAK